MNPAWKDIEVVFVLPHRCWRQALRVEADATVGEAVRLSGLDSVCHERTGRMPSAFGVYGRKITAERIVGDGERIEIYRPLIADPRERRRRRAAAR